MISTEGSSRNHIINSPRSSNNNLDSILELTLIILDIGSTNACMASNIQVVTQCNYDLLDLET